MKENMIKKISAYAVLACMGISTSQGMESPEEQEPKQFKDGKLTIVGGGIIGFMEAWQGYLSGIRDITIYEKNASISDTTTSNVVPSLTPDELISILPRGNQILKMIASNQNEPWNPLVDDLMSDKVAKQYFGEALIYSNDNEGHKKRSQALLNLGKRGMDLWQEFYDNADSELMAILEESNFQPCREPRNSGEKSLHDGYRIDLIYNVPNAANQAITMIKCFEGLGYTNCKILSPEEVIIIDPFLSYFCDVYAEPMSNRQKWKDNSVALWRPGGCIDTAVFLPLFQDYLKNKMRYINKNGELEDGFEIKFSHEVTGVEYTHCKDKTVISGLHILEGPYKKRLKTIKVNKDPKNNLFVFCPGEAVGTLDKLYLKEPAYAGFAGASLRLRISLSADELKKYATFNHCMEAHHEDVVLAWQARVKNDQVCIGVAGAKAFYGDRRPDNDQEFVKDRNLMQLNMINDLFPDFISIALRKNTKGKKMTSEDLEILSLMNIVKKWVGIRAVAYDGFPTLGKVYYVDSDKPVWNARTTTQLGSGGVSAALAAVQISRASEYALQMDPLVEQVLVYSDSRRVAKSSRRCRENVVLKPITRDASTHSVNKNSRSTNGENPSKRRKKEHWETDSSDSVVKAKEENCIIS